MSIPFTSRVAVLTGSTGTIGSAIAAGMSAYSPPTTMIMCVRDMTAGKSLQQQLIKQTSNNHIYIQHCDLGSIDSIVDACSTIKNKYGRVNVLLNGHATVPKTKQYTQDNIEQQFAVNIFSYYLLADQLLPALQQGAQTHHGSRIVNIASKFGSDLDLNDLYFDKRQYSNKDAHHAAKQANRMMTHAQADKYKAYDISCFSVHPGIVMSNLLRDVGMNKGYNTAEQGAQTPLYVCNEQSLKGSTDLYFENKRVVPCKWQNDSNNQKLYDYLEALKCKYVSK